MKKDKIFLTNITRLCKKNDKKFWPSEDQRFFACSDIYIYVVFLFSFIFLNFFFWSSVSRRVWSVRVKWSTECTPFCVVDLPLLSPHRLFLLHVPYTRIHFYACLLLVSCPDSSVQHACYNHTLSLYSTLLWLKVHQGRTTRPLSDVKKNEK